MLSFTNAWVIDGSGDSPQTVQTVVVDGASIAELRTSAPSGTQIIDLGGRTLMPGMIDVHVHLPARHYEAMHVAEQFLADGVTTVRDVGSAGQALFDLRRAIGSGYCQGPRLVLAGQIISATSPGAREYGGMYRVADDADEMRKAVREQVSRGADVIKVMVTGALTVELEDVNPSQVTDEELAALVDEAHRLGRPVAAHAEGAEGVALAVRCGVDTIEHGEMAHDIPDVLESMAAAGTVLTPTLSVFDQVADASSEYAPWVRDRARGLGEHALKTIEVARRSSVAIATGSDAEYAPGVTAMELVRLVEAGLTPMEAIAAGTSTAAAACGLADRLGTIRAGMVADLVVIDGDPLSDPRILAERQRIWLVMKEGQIVGGSREGGG